MRKHLTDGQLRAFVDGELKGGVLDHLAGCAHCQARLERIREEARPVAAELSFLSSAGEGPDLSPQAALRHFYQLYPKKETSMFKRMFASPALRIGLLAVLILAVVLSIPSTRALADELLNLFRIQQVVVVPVDFTGMQQLTGNDTLGKQFSDLITSSITMTKKPDDPVTAADASEASRLAGFDVRLPRDPTPSRISVESGAAFSFKIDRAKAQALLDEAGRSDLVLPASIDGADVSVNVPAGVSVAYGTCPSPREEDGGLDINMNGSAGRRFADCILLAEIPSPTVDAPASLDIAQLAEIGLEFTGMTSEQAAAFTQTVDWSSSLVIPIPKNAATYDQVAVDGVTGTLIQRPADDAPQYALVWVKDGIVYAISSLGTDSQKALQMANSLP